MDKVINSFIPNGSIKAPGSKSFSHRYLIGAFLSNSSLIIENINLCNDVIETIECLKKLGAEFEVNQTDLIYKGTHNIKTNSVQLNINESASTLRMLLPLLLSMFDEVKITLGNGLLNRPIEDYFSLFNKENIQYSITGNELLFKGRILDDDFEINGDISSQFISGLLFYKAYIKSGKIIHIKNNIVSKNYIEMTIKVLRDFGFDFVFENNDIYLNNITSNSIKKAVIEGDFSAISNFLVLGAVKGNIEITNIKYPSLQGDAVIVEILKNAGANIEISPTSISIKQSLLKPLNVDLTNCIDLAPILFVLASLIEGESTFKGFERLRYKESNRLESILSQLTYVGVSYKIGLDTLNIIGKTKQYSYIEFDSFCDHRISMALSVLALTKSKSSLIKGVESVNKSYPSYYKDLLALRSPLITVSIYKNSTLEVLKGKIDAAVLNIKEGSYIYDDSFNLDSAISYCNENNIIPIIALNRIFVNKEFDELIPFISNYKNTMFLVSDLGLVEYFKENGMIKNVIYHPDTLICNSSDADIYLSEGINAIGLSNEITIKDVSNISNKVDGDIFYQVFGRKMMFYSKRPLLTLYKEHTNTIFSNNVSLLEEIREDDIPVIQNDHGFYCFRPYYLSCIQDMDLLKHIKYSYIETLGLDDESIYKVVIAYKNNDSELLASLNLYIEDGFKYQDTIYIKENIVK